jgi:hypothetical protein
MAARKNTRINLPDDHELARDTKEKRVEWIVDQRIPRSMITLIAGRPGQGKSLFTAWLAAHVSQQGENVLFSNVEDLRGATTRPRLRVAGADLSKVHFWTPDLTTPEGIAQAELMIRVLDIKMLVIDPLAAHLPRKVSESRAAIRPITELCERTGLALVALHHTRKGASKKQHALDAVLGGGSGFMANARVVYLFGKNVDDPDERVLACAKTNISEEGSMTFTFDLVETEIDGEVEEVASLTLLDPLSDVPPHKILEEGTGKGKDDVDPTKRAVASEWLTSLLMFGELHVDVIRKKADEDGIAWRTIRRACDKLGIEKREQHRGFGKGRDYWWSLPKQHPALKVGAKAVTAGLDVDGQMTVEDVLALIDSAGTVPGQGPIDDEEGDDGDE